MNAIFCDAQTGLKRCSKIALFRCASCGRALCERHAVRVSSISGTSRVCSNCYRRKYLNKKRLLSILRPGPGQG